MRLRLQQFVQLDGPRFKPYRGALLAEVVRLRSRIKGRTESEFARNRSLTPIWPVALRRSCTCNAPTEVAKQARYCEDAGIYSGRLEPVIEQGVEHPGTV